MAKKVTHEESSDSEPDYIETHDPESDDEEPEPRRMKLSNNTSLPPLPKLTPSKSMKTMGVDAPADELVPHPLVNLEDMLKRDQLFSAPIRPLKVPDGYIFLVHMLSGTDSSYYKIRRDPEDHHEIVLRCDSMLKDKTVSCYTIVIQFVYLITVSHSL